MVKKRFNYEPTPTDAHYVASLALCDVRTAYRGLKGENIRGNVGKRVAAAIVALRNAHAASDTERATRGAK
jgi:hypothetical protein